MFVLENLWEIKWGGKGCFARLLPRLFCILTERPRHKHKPKWAAFINLKQQIFNPNCYVTKWNHTQLSVQFQQATKKKCSPKTCNATTSKMRHQRFSEQNLKAISPLLSTHGGLCMNFLCFDKVWGRERFQSSYSSREKKFISLKEHDEDFGKQE